MKGSSSNQSKTHTHKKKTIVKVQEMLHRMEREHSNIRR